MTKHYKILSINGGGVRGLIPAKIIKAITDKTKKPIHESFDYIVGTSAGGIIALSLTVANKNGKPIYSAEDIVNIFRDEATSIFPPSLLHSISLLQLFAPKYSREGIDKLVEKTLGNSTFLNTTMPVTTISYSLDSDGPRLWSKYKAENDPKYHNYFLKDAAGATSAAPTFFPPKVTKAPNGELFHDVDGGIFANSPTMIGVSEFLSYQGIKVHSDKLTVLSIGTGRFKDDPISSSNTNYLSDFLPIGKTTGVVICAGAFFSLGLIPFTVLCLTSIGIGSVVDGYYNTGGLGWIARMSLVEKMMKGAEISDAFQSKIVDVIRINPTFDKEYSSMDDSSSNHLLRFEKAIDNFINRHSNIINEVVSCIESKDGTQCESARSHTAHFNEDFYSEILGRSDQLSFN